MLRFRHLSYTVQVVSRCILMVSRIHLYCNTVLKGGGLGGGCFWSVLSTSHVQQDACSWFVGVKEQGCICEANCCVSSQCKQVKDPDKLSLFMVPGLLGNFVTAPSCCVGSFSHLQWRAYLEVDIGAAD